MARSSRRLAWAAVLLLAATSTAAATAATAAPAVTAPRADYQLQRQLTSSTNGAPALSNVAAGNTFITTTVDKTANRTVLKYPKGSGLALNKALQTIGAGTYTVVILYTPLIVDSSYHRILDLEAGVGDTGLYEIGGHLYAYPNVQSSTTPITSTAFSQVVLTRTPGRVVTGYVNGNKVLSFTDTGNAWVAKNLVRFGKDNTTGGLAGEETGGQFARIRMYDTALSAADVKALDRLPNGSADVGVTYTDSPDPVQHSAYLSYTATVVSNGPSDATGVSVSLTVPTGATYVGASPGTGSCAAPTGGRVVCALGTLAVGASTQVLLVVKAPAATGHTSSTATVSSASSDPSGANNSATQTTTVR